MAFTVEDGTGLTAANSLLSVADADAYHTDRETVAWADAGAAEKQVALIKATDYIRTRWGSKLRGQKLLSTQGTPFPRQYLYDQEGNLLASDEVPRLVEYATAEYANIALSADLYLTPTVDETGRPVKARKERLFRLEQEVQYDTWSRVSEVKSYPIPDSLMLQFVITGARVVRN